MARIKIEEMHGVITNKLIRNLDDIQQQNINKNLTYILDDEDEFQKLRKISYKSDAVVDNDVIAVHLTYDSINYILVTGDFKTNIYKTVDQDDAFLFVAIANSVNINVKKSVIQLDLYNEIGVENAELPFHKIKKFFPNYIVLEISSLSDSSTNIIHSVVFSLLLENNYSNLEFPSDVNCKFSELLNNVCDDVVPFENLISAYVEPSWKFSFLNLYRCIEPFFSIVWAVKMYSVFKNYTKIEEYCAYADALTDLGKKTAKEKDAFDLMVKDYSDLEIKDIYKLRNSIVHNKFEERDKTIHFEKFTDVQWSKYIVAELVLIRDLYSKYSSEYRELCKNY